ncbi:MAG: hypothetical protein KF867_06715, partial [Cryobacterium sp.]|nr:hypothetical protein [Cryobacterium sp.]
IEGGVTNSYDYPSDPINQFDLSGQYQYIGPMIDAGPHGTGVTISTLKYRNDPTHVTNPGFQAKSVRGAGHQVKRPDPISIAVGVGEIVFGIVLIAVGFQMLRDFAAIETVGAAGALETLGASEVVAQVGGLEFLIGFVAAVSMGVLFVGDGLRRIQGKETIEKAFERVYLK